MLSIPNETLSPEESATAKMKGQSVSLSAVSMSQNPDTQTLLHNEKHKRMLIKVFKNSQEMNKTNDTVATGSPYNNRNVNENFTSNKIIMVAGTESPGMQGSFPARKSIVLRKYLE